MQVVYCLLVAALIVGGQSLWKVGINSIGGLTADKLGALITNGYVIAGTFVYALATLLYMYVISRYKYGTSYSLIVGLSLIAALVLSIIVFGEKTTKINIAGAVVILIGVLLVVKK